MANLFRFLVPTKSSHNQNQRHENNDSFLVILVSEVKPEEILERERESPTLVVGNCRPTISRLRLVSIDDTRSFILCSGNVAAMMRSMTQQNGPPTQQKHSGLGMAARSKWNLFVLFLIGSLIFQFLYGFYALQLIGVSKESPSGDEEHGNLSRTQTQPQSHQSSSIKDDHCQQELNRLTLSSLNLDENPPFASFLRPINTNQTTTTTRLLSKQDYKRSRVWLGDEQRILKFVNKLKIRQEGVNVIVCGGSITMGHGIVESSGRYSDRFETWLNTFFPLQSADDNYDRNNHNATNNGQANQQSKQQQQQHQHKVYTRAAHGADMCAMAKRMDLIFDQIPTVTATERGPDLVVLEFAVNDYQGQDHHRNVDFRTDVFFYGFQQKAMCAEAVVKRLLTKYPDCAVIFLEFQSAILTRKTAQLLHMGVAQHYQIPVISYGEVIMPKYYKLLDKLQSYGYTAPIKDNQGVLSFPFGCAPCQPDHIMEFFRQDGCKKTSLCEFAKQSGLHNSNCDQILKMQQSTRQSCYMPFFAHDSVHPSYFGHAIATDLLIYNTIADVQYQACIADEYNVDDDDENQQQFLPPKSINFLGSDDELSKLTDFVFVADTMDMFGRRNHLNSQNFSNGFSYYPDGFGNRRGWIATEDQGGNYIEFVINLPNSNDHECYILYLSTLRSYEGMGTFSVVVVDETTNKSFQIDYDGIWEPRISVPADVPLVPSSSASTKTSIQNDDNGQKQQQQEEDKYTCTGKCKVTVLTHPKQPDRTGNKVKIMSLSARKCQKIK